MSISVVDSNYGTRNHAAGNNFLLSNSGQVVTEFVDIVCEFDFESSVNEQVLIVAVNQIRIMGGNWTQKGYVQGDNILIYGTVNNSTPTTFGGLSRNIIAINGDTMTLSGTLDINATFTMAGNLMPSQAGTSSNTSIGIYNNTRSAPETVELFHNLIPNNSTSGTGSLFDGEVNKFNFEGVGALAVGASVTGIQQGNKSGGSYLYYEVKRLVDVAATNWSYTAVNNVSYRVTLIYANALKFENPDFVKPSWFDSNNTVKPFYRFNARSMQNNPNSVLTGDYSGQLGNVGWRNESYNQGVNEFTVSTVITDASGNTLSEVDFSQSCIVTATITHATDNFLENAEVEFSLVPELDIVQNQLDRHCDLIQLSNFFIDATPTITSNVFGTGGAEMQTSAESLDVATPAQIIVQFTLDPNAVFTSLVESFDSLSRRYVITATVESTSGDENNNNAVTLTLKEGLLELSPVVGSPYPVRSQGFFNHANLITGTPEPTYRGCTEDDFLYKAVFYFQQNDVWTGIRLKIQVVRDSDSTTFDLVSKFVNLTNYIVNVDGEIQINYNETITQYLEAAERNQLKVNLTGNGVAPNYEVEILWSLMASWRYWIAQNNAFVDFFDGALPNNGMNAEYMRYLEIAGFSLRVRVELVDDNNTAYYFGAGIELQDYDDTSGVTTTTEYYDANGVLQSGFLANQIMTIKKIHTRPFGGAWDVNDTWGWNSIRPFENEPNKRISTVWDWTSQSYPLMPPDGETKATLTFPTPDVAVVECRVNTSMISLPNHTTIGRIESPTDPVCVSPVDYIFDMVVASSDAPIDYVEALDNFLVGGLLVKNICCPTCDVLNNDTGLLDKLYAFGSNMTAPIPSSPYNGNPVCCVDSYGTLSGCNINFDTEWGAFMLTLVGQDVLALTALVPGQVNMYSGGSMSLLISKIQSITTDISIQYNLMFVLLNRGFQVACINGGDKVISAFPT